MRHVAIKCWFIGLIVMVVSNLIINFFVTQAKAGNEESVQTLISAAKFLSVITMGILAPMVEELVFRKAFRDVFKKELFSIG